MGLFRRKQTDFDPDLWSDAAQRSPQATQDAWFEAPEDDSHELRIATNAGARFAEEDMAWLADDPGEQVRAKRRDR